MVDTNDRQVRHLETYVIQWNSGRRSVCEAVACEFNWTDPTIPRRGWSVRSIAGLRGKALLDAFDRATSVRLPEGGIHTRPMLGWCEGPFLSDDGYLESKLVGCVIGLYASPLEQPDAVNSGSES